MKGVGRLFAGLGLALLAAGAAALVWSLTQGGILLAATIPMVVTLAIMGVVFFFTGRFVGGLDMGQTIANGVPATAVILSVQDSGITVNSVNMVVNLRLRVTIEGAPPYEVDARTVLSGRTSWGALQPGMTVPVKVDPNDPNKVALDFGRGLSGSEASPAMLAQAVNAALASGPAGAQQAGMVSMKATDIIRDGLKVEGELVSVTPTGLTADKAAAGLAPAQADDPLVLIELRFTDHGGSEHSARAVARVPDGKAGFLAAGAQVPIAYLAGRPDTATIDWDRLA